MRTQFHHDACSTKASAHADRRGFSLVELLVVIAVALVLAGFLLPALSQLKEQGNRIVCSSNLRQLGMATVGYVGDWETLPVSTVLVDTDRQPRELQAAHRGSGTAEFEGLGMLYDAGYCDTPGCFYCPSHRGDHPQERYEGTWLRYRTRADEPKTEAIYTNYQYGGHLVWEDAEDGKPLRRRSLDDEGVIATDGMRSVTDYNHMVGMNILSNDGSVVWKDDNGVIYDQLYLMTTETDPVGSQSNYGQIWRNLR